MSLIISIIKGNRYVLPFSVTFSYLLVTMKNSISNSIIVYSNSIGNRVTSRIWSHNRIFRLFSNTILISKTGYFGYLSKKFVFSICKDIIKGNQKGNRKAKGNHNFSYKRITA